jgi:RNase P subunit RPR2
MPEHRVDVKPVKVKMLCEHCTMGYLYSNGIRLPINPPLYVHTCENCGFGKYFEKEYPYIEYMEI